MLRPSAYARQPAKPASSADGAWHEHTDGTLRFRQPPAPTPDEVALLAEWIARRLARMLERRGLTFRAEDGTELPEAQPDPLAACIQLALGTGHRERHGRALPPTLEESPKDPSGPGPRWSRSRGA